MNFIITTFGLRTEQNSFLAAALPESYEVVAADCVTDLIATNAICTVINATNMGEDALRVLLTYYMDVGDRLDETVIWFGNVELPDLPSFVRCDSFLDLLTNLDRIIAQAQTRYDTMQMYGGEYAYLPKHAIEESIEADINTALHRKYGSNPDPLIVKRMRQELTALWEVDAFQDLAAAFELSRWLKAKGVPFFVEYTTASGLIPYLLGVTQTNPLPPHTFCPKCKKLIWNHTYKDGFDIPEAFCPDCGAPLVRDGHNLVWQEYCSYGAIPNYGFWLPASVRDQINGWLENHWLKHTREEIWGPIQQEGHRMDAGPLYFIFALDDKELPSDFHQRRVTADQTAELIGLVCTKLASCDKQGIPYPKTAIEALAVYELTLTGGWNPCAQNLLNCGMEVSDLICCREDVFHYLCDHGFIEKDAFRGMTRVRKGKGFPVITNEMRNARDKWVLTQCADVNWLPSRASDLERLIFQIRRGFAAVSRQDLDAAINVKEAHK